MKYCKYCKELKPYNPDAKSCSKASGFHAARCWDCYRTYIRAYQQRPATDPITGLPSTYGLIARQRPVIDPVTGEAISYGLMLHRKQVTVPGTDELVSRSTAYTRKFSTTTAGRASRSQSAHKILAKAAGRPLCPWDDATKNRAIRTQAQHLTQTTGIQYHTDHIVPRFGKVVSGLECHCNLQPMVGSENGSKSNKWDVDVDSIWMHEYHLKMFEANFLHR